jgi:RNA polymerase sigma factor (sigma-70 family)
MGGVRRSQTTYLARSWGQLQKKASRLPWTRQYDVEAETGRAVVAMPNKLAAPLLGYIRGLTATCPSGELSDRDLVRRFAEQRDEAAFAALVGRHGGMVLGVGRRVLGNEDDAEDVFQATFLVLSRKAATLVKKDAVGPWLFGVAHRLALKARQQARRSSREDRSPARHSGDPLDELTIREAQAVLDEELTRLPECERGPLVLCYLEGMTQDEAARHLGCPLGTLKSRLVRGRATLHKQLARRGLSLATVVSTLLLAGKSAAAPGQLQTATVKAATAIAAGSSAVGIIGPKAVALAEGALKPALWGKLTIVLVVLGLIAGGIGVGPTARPTVQEPVADRSKVDAVAALPRHHNVPQTIAKWWHHADLAAHEKAARALAFSRDGGRLASAGDDGRVRVWDVNRAKELLTLRGQDAHPLRAVALGSGGDLLAAGNDDGAVFLWDLRGKGRPTPDVVFERAGREVHAVWVGADRGAVARAWCDGCVEWQGGSPGQPHSLPGQAGKVHGVALCREGRTAAWAMHDGSVKLWDLARREQRGHFRVHASQVGCLAFSPEGDRAASVDQSATLKVWDTTTGLEQATARVPRGPVRALALASGGKLLASGGDDGTVRIWDARTGQELAALDGHRGRIYSVAFSPDGRFLASASSDGTVKLWTCTPAVAARGR